MNKHLKCEQLLKDTNKEYERLISSINGLLRGNKSAKEVNDTAESVFNNIDNLIADYKTKRG